MKNVLLGLYKEIKKKLVLIVMCTVIIGACWFLTFRHYTQFNQQDDLIAKLETGLLDLKFLLRGKEKPRKKVGILAIDEKSLELFGQWPIARKHYAQALDNLRKLGVRWIGFDAIFSEAEATKLDDVKEHFVTLRGIKGSNWQAKMHESLNEIDRLRESSPSDRTLADAVAAFKNIILGYFYFESPHEVEASGRKHIAFQGLDAMLNSEIAAVITPGDRQLSSYPDSLKAYGLVANTPVISKAGQHFAFFSNQADNDAIVRWVTQIKILDGHLMPSLSLKMAAEAMNRDILVVFDRLGVESIELISRDDESDAVKIPTDPYGQGRVLANHRGPSQSFRHISLADAYKNSFSDEQKAFLKDSLLLLGMTAIGINDQRPNPFDPAIDGVENHAAVLDNILSRDFMQRPKSIFSTELILLLSLGLLFAPIMIYSRATYSGLLVCSFLVGYYYFDKYYWFDKGIWAYIGMPFLEILLLFICITLYKYVVEEKEKRKVKGAFSHYLSPEVINQVLDDPEALQLGGVRKELTVFFSDVRSFTTISESLTPEQLCEFMNAYFTPMTDIILRHRGVLDKYIGDAIMAFWGAPIPLPNQADVAARASIEMLFALDKLQLDFKARGLPRCDIGIGLNTGPMSVGNMGSDERFCYTVMGDSVNLGSRLEGLTKEYGIKILVSEFTVAKFTEKHLVRDLDDIRVKGKNEPIKVFDLMRPDALKSPQAIAELIGHFEEGRKFYRAQEWKQAGSKFKECLRIHPQDGPSLVYLKRVEEHGDRAKIVNWDGVYTFNHK